jgi:hypothetical protein
VHMLEFSIKLKQWRLRHAEVVAHRSG